MTNRVILIESEKQLDMIVTGDYLDSNNRVVALTPEADYAAEKAGLHYSTIEELYSEKELIEKGIHNYQRVGRFCDALDQHIRGRLGDEPLIDAFSTHHFFYHLKILFDALLNRAMMLNSAFTQLKPTEVIYFETYPEPVQDDLFFRKESVASHLAPLVAAKFGCTVTELPAVPSLSRQTMTVPESRNISWKHRCFQAVRRLPFGKWFLSVVRRFKSEGQTFLPTSAPNGPSLLLLDRRRDVGFVARRWKEQCIGPVLTLGDMMAVGAYDERREGTDSVQVQRADVERSLRRLWSDLKRDPDFSGYFEYENTNCFPAAERRIFYFVTEVIPKFFAEAKKIDVCLRQFPVDVVLGTSPVAIPQIACMALARTRDIPTVIHQHGGGLGYNKQVMLEHLDFYFPKYVFCCGSGIVKYCTKPLPSAHRSEHKPRAIHLAIGSSALDDLAQQKESTRRTNDMLSGKRTVVYVTNAIHGATRYHSYHLYPDIWYWRLQREIIQVCVQFPEIDLLYKAFPNERLKNPVEDWVQQENIPNCQIVRDIPFSNMLHVADLFIIDYPSTVLLEALTTNKKVIVFAGRRFIRFDPKATALLTKRVLFSKTKEQFLWDIEATLQEPDWTLPDPVNDEFLKAYGTHLNDGRSAWRAVDALHVLASEHRMPDFALAGYQGQDRR